MEHTSLNDLLSEDEPAQNESTATDATPRDEQGRFAPKTTGVEESAAVHENPVEAQSEPPSDKLPKEDYKAVREEREKRQAVERQLEELRQQINSQPKEPPPPPPSIWEDDQAWQQHFGTQIAQQASFNAKLDMSEMLARQNNPDFDEVKTEFLRMAESNPALAQQALGDPHPWAKAYQIAKNAKTMQELGATDLDGLKAKLREELMAEMQQETPAATRLMLPPTLSTAQNVGSRSGPVWGGPTPLADLLG